MAETLELFGTTLNDIANGPHLGGLDGVTEALMRRLSEKGLPLEQLCDRRMMDRSRRTLEARAREFGIAFPDYVPLKLRKQLTFVQRGDFFELHSEHVPAVAGLLTVVARGTREEPMLALPAHSIDEAREQLQAAWYVVKLVRQKAKRSPKKVAQNAA
jgi:hypothetical protein